MSFFPIAIRTSLAGIQGSTISDFANRLFLVSINTFQCLIGFGNLVVLIGREPGIDLLLDVLLTLLLKYVDQLLLALLLVLLDFVVDDLDDVPEVLELVDA